MSTLLHARTRRCALVITLIATTALGAAQNKEFEPTVGQPGKDVVWVPTPEPMVEKMLDLAGVTPQDFVVDLGSGDGRNVIAAAKRGARSLGVEYNPDMVDLSKRNAEKAGVGDKAQFVKGDMYEADFSKANVLALFLLPSNLLQLRAKFLELRPGSRIVSNTFFIEEWPPDQTVAVDDCTSWCTAILYIVPAKVGGTWRMPQGELTLNQKYQMVTGTLMSQGKPVEVTGKLNGENITFTAGAQEFKGKLRGTALEGTVSTKGGASSSWSATKVGS
jgi:methyltransferase family protein